MVKVAYDELFKLHGDAAWELPFDSLISFFRNNDETSDVVGRRQASTFQALSGLAGHGEAPSSSKAKQPKESKAKNGKLKQAKGAPPAPVQTTGTQLQSGNGGQRDVGLAARGGTS